MVASVNLNQLNNLTATSTQTQQAVTATTQQMETLFQTTNVNQQNNAQEAAAPTTLAGINDEIAVCKAKIEQYQNQLADINEKIEQLTKIQETWYDRQGNAQDIYDTKNTELNNYQTQLSNTLLQAMDSSGTVSRTYQSEVQTAVNAAVNEYKSGSNPNANFQQILMSKLGAVGGLDTSSIEAHLSAADSIGGAINNLVGSIGSVVDELNTINTNLTEIESQLSALNNQRIGLQNGINVQEAKITNLQAQRTPIIDAIIQKYKAPFNGGDPATWGNPQVQSLAKFLEAGEMNDMTKDETLKVLGSCFGSAIGVNGNNVAVPFGHDGQATATFASLTAKLQSLYSDLNVQGVNQSVSVSRTDPIGFKSGNTTFDFVADKNKDGIFNDKNEFLGAKNGWAEMLELDTNKDGLISGTELDKLMVLSRSKDSGINNISSASSLGIKNIDLNSYQAQNTKDANNNILAGTFKVDYKNQSIQGTQTLDTDEYLQRNFGHIFGMSVMPKKSDISSVQKLSSEIDDSYIKASMTASEEINLFKANIMKDLDITKDYEKRLYKEDRK